MRLAFVFAVFVATTLAVEPQRVAYMTTYSEESDLRGEKLLGVRVLLQSLKPLKHPFVVAAFESLSGETQKILMDEGASVMTVPQLEQENHFPPGSFLVVRGWNLTRFDRVIYLSSETVVVHPDRLEELFECGEMCVQYSSTPCAFNVNIFSFKPSAATHERLTKLLQAADPLTMPPYYRPEQHLLSQAFAICEEAPLFNPARGVSHAPCNRLSIEYFMPLFYYMEKRNWDLFRCGRTSALADPAITIGFGAPLAPAVQPWFWWSPFIQPAHWWLRHRAALSETSLLVAGAIYVVITLLIVGALAIRGIPELIRLRGVRITPFQFFTARIGPAPSAFLCTLVFCLLSALFAKSSFPALLPPIAGWPAFIIVYHTYLLCLARLCYVFVLPRSRSQVLPMLSDLRLSLLAWTLIACQPFVDDALASMLRWNIVCKIFATLPSVLLLLTSQFLIFHRPVLFRHPNEL